MKFIVFTMYSATKVQDVTQASDRINSNPPKGTKILGMYTCLGIPFPQGFPENIPSPAMTTISIREAASGEALTAALYPIMLAGATLYAVPVMEANIGKTAEQEKSFRVK